MKAPLPWKLRGLAYWHRPEGFVFDADQQGELGVVVNCVVVEFSHILKFINPLEYEVDNLHYPFTFSYNFSNMYHHLSSPL